LVTVPTRKRAGPGPLPSEVEVRHRLAAVEEALQAGEHLAPAEVTTLNTRRLYRANREALGRLGQVLEQLWAAQLDELAALAEAAERRRRG
jgi:hypothetical protein